MRQTVRQQSRAQVTIGDHDTVDVQGQVPGLRASSSLETRHKQSERLDLAR